jgi:hypothetical protein
MTKQAAIDLHQGKYTLNFSSGFHVKEPGFMTKSAFNDSLPTCPVKEGRLPAARYEIIPSFNFPPGKQVYRQSVSWVRRIKIHICN